MNRDQSRFLYNSVRFLDNCWFSGKAVIGITWRTLFGRLAWLTNCLGGALSSYGRNGRLAGLTNCLGGAFSSCGRNWPMHGPISDGCADPGADRLRVTPQVRCRRHSHPPASTTDWAAEPSPTRAVSKPGI